MAAYHEPMLLQDGDNGSALCGDRRAIGAPNVDVVVGFGHCCWLAYCVLLMCFLAYGWRALTARLA
jgi:hypothetical protein